jgi:hypothetical protein
MPTLGINVYEHAFDQYSGMQLLEVRDNIHILLLKCEISDVMKEKYIGDFINLRKLKIENSNLSDSKYYQHAYSEFIKQLKLPQEYIQEMLDSKYAKHFYSEQEINNLRIKWEL